MNRFVNAITTLKLPFYAFKEHLNSSNAAASVALLFQIFKELAHCSREQRRMQRHKFLCICIRRRFRMIGGS